MNQKTSDINGFSQDEKEQHFLSLTPCGLILTRLRWRIAIGTLGASSPQPPTDRPEGGTVGGGAGGTPAPSA